MGEKEVPTQRRRLEDFAAATGWGGKIVEIDDEAVPGCESVPDFAQDWVLDTARIRAELGYREVSGYQQGIRDTVQWQGANPNPAVDPKQFDYAGEDRVLAGI